MSTIRDLPELSGGGRRSVIRIPPEVDVPLTPRVRSIIDTAAFRRLARISQLGLVSLIYPAAIHTRFEHSLGVYRLALLFLEQLSRDERFAATVSAADAELLIATALLHDIGHWPFCHPLEDIRLPNVPKHEQFAERFILDEIGEVLRRDWNIDPANVLAILDHTSTSPASHVLDSILSGPIDIDKMDYLARDSLHAGVPYGRNFDQQRLIGSLCLNRAGDGLAISDKGKTAAEMMVFARYVMFSEVYWHHGVRAATAMLQRAFYRLYPRLDLQQTFTLDESHMVALLRQAAADSTECAGPARLLEGLFGPRRLLFKRLAQYSYFEQPDLYGRLARRPYPWLVRCAEIFSSLAAAEIGQTVAADSVLFDAPPRQREVEFNVEVYFTKTGEYRTLETISPVVTTLARQQFDDYVKRVRVFVAPQLAGPLRAVADIPRLLHRAIDETEAA